MPLEKHKGIYYLNIITTKISKKQLRMSMNPKSYYHININSKLRIIFKIPQTKKY